MADKGWKQFERRIAADFGTSRIGPTGDDGPDILTENHSIQCKLRKSIPRWLVDALANAVAGAREGRIGWAIVKRSGRGHPDSEALVVVRYADWKRIMLVYDAMRKGDEECHA